MQKKGNLGHDCPWFTDQYLLRFCRARRFDHAKTIKMWEELIATRVKNEVETLCTNFVYEEKDKVLEVYPKGYYGVDRRGHPVFYDLGGKVNPDDIWKVTTEERFFKFFYEDYERTAKFRMYAMSHYTQTQVTEITSVFDLKGFGISKMNKKTKALLGEGLKIASNYYPEMLAVSIVINTPTSFKAVWAFIKSFLDEKQRNKILIVGSKYHDKLFKIIEPEYVPTFLGGKCELPFIQGDQNAPWGQNYELEDGPGRTIDEVGVRHKKTGELFTPRMLMALKNPIVMGPGISGSQGAMILQGDGSAATTAQRYIPNKNVQIDDPATLVNRDMDLSSQAAEEFTEDQVDESESGGSKEGLTVPSKFEEEKQSDGDGGNYQNKLQKEKEEADQIAETQKKDADAYKMDL